MMSIFDDGVRADVAKYLRRLSNHTSILPANAGAISVMRRLGIERDESGWFTPSKIDLVEVYDKIRHLLPIGELTDINQLEGVALAVELSPDLSMQLIGEEDIRHFGLALLRKGLNDDDEIEEG